TVTIESLKSNIERTLDHLVENLDSFKETEKQRYATATSQTDSLKEMLNNSEVEVKILQEHLAEQRVLARQDNLTKLPNRAAFEDKIEEEIKKVAKGSKFFIAMGDVDNFKKLNDAYGHLAGDKVLIQVAKVLRKGLHLDDFVARYGGEEFVILLVDKNQKETQEILDKIRESLEELPFYFKSTDSKIKVTISFGFAEYNKKYSVDEILEKADAALYKAKETRNATCFEK
ncbi:MAG: GGDEF domain-containing protein, partial [Romboutsia sp.]|nr:GGDEF domain-containing protein [Romboutsia sp.]